MSFLSCLGLSTVILAVSFGLTAIMSRLCAGINMVAWQWQQLGILVPIMCVPTILVMAIGFYFIPTVTVIFLIVTTLISVGSSVWMKIVK